MKRKTLTQTFKFENELSQSPKREDQNTKCPKDVTRDKDSADTEVTRKDQLEMYDFSNKQDDEKTNTETAATFSLSGLASAVQDPQESSGLLDSVASPCTSTDVLYATCFRPKQEKQQKRLPSLPGCSSSTGSNQSNASVFGGYDVTKCGGASVLGNEEILSIIKLQDLPLLQEVLKGQEMKDFR